MSARADQDGESPFVPVRDAAELAGVSDETIRRWARDGNVRARRRGRIVEYYRQDVLSVAGRMPVSPEQAEIERLRIRLEQTQIERDTLAERAKRRQEKLDSFQRRWTRRLEEERRQRAGVEAACRQWEQDYHTLAADRQACRQRLAELEQHVRHQIWQDEQARTDMAQMKSRVEQVQQERSAARQTVQRVTADVQEVRAALQRQHEREQQMRADFIAFVNTVLEDASRTRLLGRFDAGFYQQQLADLLARYGQE